MQGVVSTQGSIFVASLQAGIFRRGERCFWKLLRVLTCCKNMLAAGTWFDLLGVVGNASPRGFPFQDLSSIDRVNPAKERSTIASEALRFAC